MITWVYSSMQAWFSSPKSSDITQVSIVGWLDKQNVVHPYSGILLSLQRKAILQYAEHGHTLWTSGQSWMDILCDSTYTSHRHGDRKQNGAADVWARGGGELPTGQSLRFTPSCSPAAWQLCGRAHGFNATALKAHRLLRSSFGVCILTQYKKRHNNDKKEMSYQAIKRHRGTLHTYCWVKEADLRRLRALVHSIYPSQSRDPPEEAKLQTVLRSVAAGVGRGGINRQAELQHRDTTLYCCPEDTCAYALVKLQAEGVPRADLPKHPRGVPGPRPSGLPCPPSARPSPGQSWALLHLYSFKRCLSVSSPLCVLWSTDSPSMVRNSKISICPIFCFLLQSWS